MKKLKSFLVRIKADPDNHHISIYWFFIPKIILLGTYESWYPIGIFESVFIDDTVRLTTFALISIIIWYLINALIGLLKKNN